MSENMITISADNETVRTVVNQIKSDMRGSGRYAAYVAEFSVTRETVKDHALALATLVYPNDAPVQKKDGQRTRFGNAVQAAGNGLRSALGKDETEKQTDWLRLVRQAAENAANKGEFPAERIIAEVTEALFGENADLRVVA
jgi:hypothetical protein